MVITEQIEPHLAELEKYSINLFAFLVENFENPITPMSQMEFNCLFRVYSDKLNFICSKFDLNEDDVSQFSMNDEKFDELASHDIDPDEAVDMFMEYLNQFLLELENKPLVLSN